VKIVKNKVAAPFRDAEFDILYGEGISREGDTLDLAVLHNIVDKSGAWYSFQGERIGQGRENVRNFLKANREIFGRIDADLRTKMGISASTLPVPPIPDDGEEQAVVAVKGKKS
jgi:recombination protein RecA